jgi:hypothetical protein
MNMDHEHRAEQEIKETCGRIVELARELPSFAADNPMATGGFVRRIAGLYSKAIEIAPFHYHVNLLPGNAALAAAVEAGGGDTGLYFRLRSAVEEAIVSRFPSLAKVGTGAGVDVALMLASKTKREHDKIVSELTSFQFSAPVADMPAVFARVRREVLSDEAVRLEGLRDDIVGGNIPTDMLTSIAYDSLHDLVFFSTLDEASKEEFNEHVRIDVETALANAANTVPAKTEQHAAQIKTVEFNLAHMFGRVEQAGLRTHAA